MKLPLSIESETDYQIHILKDDYPCMCKKEKERERESEVHKKRECEVQRERKRERATTQLEDR